MPRPQIPPQVLAARGVPIRLLDDTEVRVCYTFHSLMVLEEKHGGLVGAMQALSDPDSAQFGQIAALLAAGLEHEAYDVVEPPSFQGGQPTTNRVTLDNVEVLGYLLDSQNLGPYAEAMGKAFKQAFPEQVAKAEAAQEDGADPTPASRGQSGSTSAPSTSAGPPTSSGA